MGDEKSMSEKAFSRDDLFLLMKSYENSVQQNTILLSQQQKMTTHQEQLIDKQVEMFNVIQTILGKFEACSLNVNRVEESIHNSIDLISETMSHETQKVSTIMATIITDQNSKMTENRNECEKDHEKLIKCMDKNKTDFEKDYGITMTGVTKDHTRLSLKIYGLYALLAGIIISLITLLVDANKKIDIIIKIAQFLGVNI